MRQLESGIIDDLIGDVQVNQVLTCYRTELEREIRLTTDNTIETLKTLIAEMNEICGRERVAVSQ